MRYINYYELGATLYIPVVHRNLDLILKREKYPFLKSIVICLEDSISSDELILGMRKLEKILLTFQQSDMKVFIRPRNINNLKDVLVLKNIFLIDGFAIPKFDITNIDSYLYIFNRNKNFYIMPILETQNIFFIDNLRIILKKLIKIQDRILVVRVGGEDILNLLNIIRDCNKTIYEILPLYLILSNIMNIFIPKNFKISSPVYSYFGDMNKSFEAELKLDIEHQILNKTTIHPKQVLFIQKAYQITQEELDISQKILDGDKAVFNYKDRMYEKKTHSNWARIIQLRFHNFGLVSKV